MSVARFDRWENTAGSKYENVGAVYTKTSSISLFIAGTANVAYPVNANELLIEIDPRSRNSQFLLMASIFLGNNTNNAGFRFTRNGALVGVGTQVNSRPQMTAITGWLATGGDHSSIPVTSQYVDAPMSTERISYNIEIMGEGGTLYLNRSPGWVTEAATPSKATLTSTFTVIELI
jgi:hypothetical protein